MNRYGMLKHSFTIHYKALMHKPLLSKVLMCKDFAFMGFVFKGLVFQELVYKEITYKSLICSLLFLSSFPAFSEQGVTIPKFQLVVGDSMLTMHSRKTTLRERDGSHKRYHDVREEGFVRFVLRQKPQANEQQRWKVNYLENFKGSGQYLNMSYEDRRLMGSSAVALLQDNHWQLVEEDPGDEIYDGYTGDDRQHFIKAVNAGNFYDVMSTIISSHSYTLDKTYPVNEKYTGGLGGKSTIRLADVTEKWGKPVAEFVIDIETFKGKETLTPCRYQLTVLKDDGRITDITFSCDLTLVQEPNWVSGFIVERLSYSYGNRSISEFSPEPVLNVHPQGEVTAIQFIPETNLLAFLSKGRDSNGSNWLTFWDLTQRKTLYSSPASGDQLKFDAEGSTLSVVSDDRFIENYVSIADKFRPFGQVVDFDLERGIKSAASFGHYTLTLNEKDEIELFNSGYNSKQTLLELKKTASQLTARNDGRVLVVSDDGYTSLYKLNVSHESCKGGRDFTQSWCSKPDVTFEIVQEAITLGTLFTGDSQSNPRLDYLELHSNLPKAIYCSSESERCGLLDYEQKSIVEINTKRLSFSRDHDLLISRNGQYNYQGEWKFGYESPWSLVENKAQALDDDKKILFAGGEKVIGNNFEPVIELIDKDEGIVLDQIHSQVDPIADIFHYGSSLYLVSHDYLAGKTEIKEVNLDTLEVISEQLPFIANEISIDNDVMLIRSQAVNLLISMEGNFPPVHLPRKIVDSHWIENGLLYLSDDNALYKYSLLDGMEHLMHQFSEAAYEVVSLNKNGTDYVVLAAGGRLLLPNHAKELKAGYVNAPYSALISDGIENGFIATGLSEMDNFYNASIPLISRFNAKGEKVDTFEANWGTTTAQLVTDNKQLWLGDEKGSITVRNMASGTITENFRAHNGQVTAMLELDNNLIVSASAMGEIKFWRPDRVGLLPIHQRMSTSFPLLEHDIANRQGKLALTMVVDSSGEIVLSTPEGYYWGTPKGIHRASFVNKKQLFDYRRYDLWLNRPDIILERLGYSDKSQIKMWRIIVEARQNRSPGFKPELNVKDTKDFQFTVTGEASFKQQDDVTLEWTMSEDFNGQLHVLVNETPVFGSKGQPISGALGSLQIELSSGLNTIRLFAEDEAGNKTRSQTVSYFRPQIKRKPDLYIVSVGVSKYQYPELNLSYARKDAEDMLSLFQNSEAFNKVINLSLHDENVTRESMEQVKQFVSQAKADDRLVVFFAGHGFLDKQEKYYFAAHDITPDSPEVRGISYQTISDVIDASPSRYKLLMLDTCHSGEVNEFASNNNSKLAEGVVSRGFKVKSRKPTEQDGLNKSYQKLQTAFVDLRASTGAVVISASGGYEFALEKSNIGNGVFTSAVIKGLSEQAADLNQDGIVQISELREYTYAEVKRLTDGQQQPTTRSYNLDTDFVLY